jgi:hypothetical protein
MARKHSPDLRHYHDFTKNIHSTARSGTEASGLKNWNEKIAKLDNRLSCHDCRYFDSGCYIMLGKYHMPCKEFEWW